MLNASSAAQEAMKREGPLALGCWVFGGTGWGNQSDDDSREAMAAAWDGGVRHWDLALAYGAGRAEQLCGDFLKGRRHEAYLATKGVPGPDPESIDRSLSESHRNAGTDYFDLYYFHWPRSGVDLRPYMARLEAARTRGQIRAIGVSNFSPAQMDQVREAGNVDVHQLCYSLLWRRADHDVIPYCARHGIAMAGYSPLAQGLLAGGLNRRPPFQDGDVRKDTVFSDPRCSRQVFEAAEECERLARVAGRPATHLAIQWILQHTPISVVIVGARNGRQAKENIAALQDRLSPGLMADLTALSERLRPHLPDEGNIFRYYP